MEILYLFGFCILWFLACMGTMYLFMYPLIRAQKEDHEIRRKKLIVRRSDLEERIRKRTNVSSGS